MRLVTLLSIALAAVAAAPAFAGPVIVFDPKTGEVLGAERAGEPWYPASLTKLMTAYVVFQRLREGRLKLDQQIPVSTLAADQAPSKIGVPTGKTVTVDFALQALLVYSANDMAYVLAEAAGGSVPAFVNEMNLTAKRLGLTGSYFANPNGWFDERQVITARDIGVLASALLQQFPERSHYYAQDILQIGAKKLRNRNSLLRRMQGADGMKTGFICNSGYNLVATATLDGRKLMAVVLGAANGAARVNKAEELLVAGFLKPREAGALRIGEIANFELGSLVPADLTPQVCRAKPEVEMARASDLRGWGISLGRYATAVDANKALRARVLGARHILQGGMPGIVGITGTEGYNAMIWNLEEKGAVDVCVHFAREKILCDVITPENFARIAALVPDQPKLPAIEQGGEDDDGEVEAPPKKKPKAKAKAKRKRVKAKIKVR